MNEHETIADIIAEKRLRAAEMEKTLGDQHSFVESLKNDTDRLEAAHKREAAFHAMTCEANERLREHLQIALDADKRERGDCTKLREALKAAKKYLDGYTVNILELRRTVDAALASPPRNCDIYNNESCRMAYHLNGDGLMTMQAFADWLFAPATEKEGGKVE